MQSLRQIIATLLILALPGCTTIKHPKDTTADPNRTLLIGGTWARHLDEKIFFADGTYESHDRSSEKPVHGRWTFNGDLLKMTEGNQTTTHRIISIDVKNLEMTFGDGTEGLEYSRFAD